VEYGIFYLPTFYPEPATDSVALYASLRDQARRADALGFHSFWLAEHHFHGFGGMLPSPPVVIPWLAAETPRIRYGTAVALLPFHNPLLLAEDYATVDVLTGGRLEFGVGLGFQKLEADNLDAPMETARERFYEHLDVILRAWTSERLDHDGPHYQYRGLRVLPRPVQRPHPPIWVGATATPESFRWAGEHGYGMMTIGHLHDVADLKERIALYREAYRAAGHPPEGEKVLGAYHTFVSRDAAQARAVGARGLEVYGLTASQAREWAGAGSTEAAFPAHTPVLQRTRALSFDEMLARSRAIVGEPAVCRDTLAYLREELGLTHAAFLFALGELPYDAVLRSMDLFADQVLGQLSSR
jgi:natural product biosynthesis luciferase-like monooxygenase protein